MESMLSPRMVRTPKSDEEDFYVDLEDVSKTRPRTRSVDAQLFPARARAGLVAYWIVLVILVDPPFLMYFLSIVGTGLGFVLLKDKCTTHASPSSTRSLRKVGLAMSYVLAAAAAFSWLKRYEIDRVDMDFNFDALQTGGLQHDISFFRMYNPSLNYNEDIERIHVYMNNGSVETVKMPIDPSMDAWSSDVFRYEFLQRVWELAPSDYRVVCITESDVVFDEGYVAAVLKSERSRPLELAHAQHFWGHHVFESYSIGLLCTSSHASQRTRLWAKMMSYLHRKRYRRLLQLDVLFSLVPQRLVFYWDAHHGCTVFHAHCKYIHFTKPKYSAIIEANQKIDQLEVDDSH